MRTLVHLPYRFVPLALDQHLMPRAAWTVLGVAISSEGGVVETQCAPLLAFLRVAALEGSMITFAAADLEFVVPDKYLEAQRMEILQRDLPALRHGSFGGGPRRGMPWLLPLAPLRRARICLSVPVQRVMAPPGRYKLKRLRRGGEQFWRERSAFTDAWMRADSRRCTPHSPLHQREGRGSRCRVSTRPARTHQMRRRPFRPSASSPQKARSCDSRPQRL